MLYLLVIALYRDLLCKVRHAGRAKERASQDHQQHVGSSNQCECVRGYRHREIAASSDLPRNTCVKAGVLIAVDQKISPP